MEATPSPFVDAAQLAAHWGMSRAYVYELLALGLPSVKVGRLRRFRVADADAWLVAHFSEVR